MRFFSLLSALAIVFVVQTAVRLDSYHDVTFCISRCRSVASVPEARQSTALQLQKHMKYRNSVPS